MCGRFALAMQRAEIRDLPGYPRLNVQGWVGEDDFVPRYNIAPNTQAPVIRRTPGDASTTKKPSSSAEQQPPASSSASGEPAADSGRVGLVMHTMRWGIKYGKERGAQAINARSENLVEGVGMWNRFRGRNRCIVICQGYYEWQTKGKNKLPHFIRHSSGDKVMLMAGLYESVVEKDGSEPAYTFAIVTTDASKGLSWLHDRQPVILSSVEDVNRWLDTSSQTWSAELAKLLHPWEDAKAPLQCYQVPKEVGKVGAESPTFIQPLSTRKDGIQAMFAKQRSKQEATTTAKRKRELSLPGKSDEPQNDEKKVKRES
ncbi:hypothetical protein M404DRAFT_1006897 [Pisolithus tinctorius Marx 270]|uniref:DUF159-domain-containing protein n=1 Tax=Pisolithus tinctorius Marx 270 TaxID=870435 RepID=A0A0C3NKV7_PISTI|nr:hypothetical protein M404DRAFT_1006897 [Pisolithus tinctorius Marx 270]